MLRAGAPLPCPAPASASPLQGASGERSAERLVNEAGEGELGRLLRERLVPMPVRIEGAILWFADEVAIAIADGHIPGLLARRRPARTHR